MKIAIAGFGAEGRSNYEYFCRQFPDAEVVVVDENPVKDPPSDAIVVTGEGVFSNLDDADLVIRTAGLAPSKISTSGKVWSATNEFFDRCPAPIIGVTGTKGKGTTSSFIAEILKSSGRTVHLVGNIGVPSLDVLPEIKPQDVVVYELSSFQLWDLEKSPHVAVVLMIEPDHLDVHDGIDDYVQAKGNIARRQSESDFIVYNPSSDHIRQIVELSQAKHVVCEADLSDVVLQSLKLPGRHNQENLSASIEAAKCIEPNLSDEVIAQGVAGFTGLPHRLRFVAERGGVKFYDDSIATTPGSAIAALRSFEAPKVIILGGSDKGADYDELAKEIASSNVRSVILIGSNTDKLSAVLEKSGAESRVELMGRALMSDIVSVAWESAHPGDVVILSPAAASFDMFNSYVDRGNQYIEAVNNLPDEVDSAAA